MKRYDLLMVALLFAALLGGCGGEQAVSPPPAAKAVAKPPVPAAAPLVEPAVVPGEESRYVYAWQDRRDPFVPIAGKRVASFAENPLESFDLLQFELRGVIIGMGEPKAMVAAPDGKSYILKKGLRIGKNRGVIRDITRDKVLVEERYQDLSGATRSMIQEIKVPKREGV